MVDAGSDNLIEIKKKTKLGSSASLLGLALATAGNLKKHMGSSNPWHKCVDEMSSFQIPQFKLQKIYHLIDSVKVWVSMIIVLCNIN